MIFSGSWDNYNNEQPFRLRRYLFILKRGAHRINVTVNLDENKK